MIPSTALPASVSGTTASADVVAAGLPIPPIERIRVFSDSQWEDFVLEWADSLGDQYGTVERCGGAGNMGRDIIAFDKANPAIWDNYQSKHYKDGLIPSDIWVELGKLVYRSIAEDFRASQVIIFENEDPPSELGADANIIRFTGASHGRQGFIPKSA